MKTTNLIALACAAMAAASAGAQQVTFYSDGRPERVFRPISGLANQDVKFLKMAANANKFEIEAGRIAQSNGSSAFTMQFAKEMVMDHTAGQNEAAQVAGNKSVDVAGDLPLPLQAKLNKLRNLKGESFDNAFRAAQKAGHEDCIKMFKQEIADGRDEDVKAMAVKMLPMIELHYRMILSGKTMMGETATDHGI